VDLEEHRVRFSKRKLMLSPTEMRRFRVISMWWARAASRTFS
jgi:hypothetical protein